MNSNLTKYLTFACVILLAIGCFPLPYGYYILMRLIVFCTCIAIIITDKERGFNYSNVIWGIIGLLFNPFIPIHLYSKTIWIIIDAIMTIVMAYKTYHYHKRRKV